MCVFCSRSRFLRSFGFGFLLLRICCVDRWIWCSSAYMYLCLYVNVFLRIYSPIRFSIKALQMRWNQFHSSILDRFMHRIRVVVHYHPTPTSPHKQLQMQYFIIYIYIMLYASTYIHSFILSINCIFFIIPFRTVFLLLLYLQGYCCCELT